MICNVVGARNPVQQSGVEWFGTLNEEQQKEILGQTKWAAWHDKKFQLADLPGISRDPVYGDMKVERSLKDLLGEL